MTKKKKKYYEITAKILLDRFFDICRSKHHIYAFQNESKLKYDFLKEMGIACVVTLQAKRCFFAKDSDNKLSENGFVIEYNQLTKEMFLKIKEELMNHFKNSFYIKFPKEDYKNKEKNYFSGKIIIKNFHSEEEEKND